MNSEKKIKVLVSVVAFLLMINIVIIIFFLSLNNDKKGQSGSHDTNLIGTFLKNELGFSPQQMRVFDTMRNQHLRDIKPFFERLKYAKDSFYNLLYKDRLVDSTTKFRVAIIGERQADIDRNFFNYLVEVRKLCTPKQLPKFDSSFKDIISKITARSRKVTDHKNEK